MTKTSHRIIDGHNDAAQYLYVPDKLPGYKFIADNAEAAVDLPTLKLGVLPYLIHLCAQKLFQMLHPIVQ